MSKEIVTLERKVFLSWSGEQSQRVAEELHEWLPLVFQDIQLFMSSETIEKGARWGPSLDESLSENSVGIICLTRDNLNAPWILYEAGSLASELDSSRVCTLLLDIEPSDLAPPLSNFQATNFERKEDFFKLLKTINTIQGTRQLSDKVLTTTFEKFWPDLQGKIEIGQRTADEKSIRTDRELLEEILTIARSEAKQLSNLKIRNNPLTNRAVINLIVGLQSVHKQMLSLGHDDAAQILRNLQPLLDAISDSDAELSEQLGDFPEITFLAL